MSAPAQAPDLSNRRQYAVELKLFGESDKLLTETSIAVLDGLPGMIESSSNRMEQSSDGNMRPFQNLKMMVVIETGSSCCWPSLENTREIVDEALWQSEIVEVGPATLWIYHPDAERYEVSISEMVVDDSMQTKEIIPCGSACGWLSCMEPIEPQLVPEDAGVGGGSVNWQKGN
ncbi:hypothetical protein IT575_06415 [bacterium]|nr:hypothetical protein [bacterium]